MPKINEFKKEERKRLILDAALKEFSTKGYTRTSLDDIVRTAGISKGGIYNYFRSKEEIFLALANDVALVRHSLLEEFPDTMSYTNRIKNYINQTVANFEERKAKIKFSFEFWVEYSDKDMLGPVSKKEFLDNRFDYFMADLNTIIRGGIQAGEFRDDLDPDTIPFLLLASLDGLAFFSSILERKLPGNSAKILGDMFISILKKK